MFWQKVKDLLAEKLSETDFNLWIEPLLCSRGEEQTLNLVGPDPYFCSWVRKHYLAEIENALTCLGFLDKKVFISARRQDEGQKLLPEPVSASKQEQLRFPAMPVIRSSVRALHPRYTFAEFMVGESNAMAHSACESMAKGGRDYAPCLFIEAGTGLGKSHLTHAVAHHIMGNFPGTRLHYVTLQQLTAEMVRNLKNNTMEHFKEKYHHQCDVLLMEDVQSLTGRTKTQTELAEALDVLMDCGKRVIFTSSLSPRKIPDIGEGVRSRLSSGLVAAIKPPDRQTRCLIIERKARNNRLDLSPDIIDFLSDRICGDVRRLESAIVGLKAKSVLHKARPDIDMAREIITGIVGRKQDLSTSLIRDFIAGQFNVSVVDLQSKSRHRSIAFPRQISMYLARKFTDEALAEIGKAFNRDHSTVAHSIKVVCDAMVRNGSVRGQVEHLSQRLKNQA